MKILKTILKALALVFLVALPVLASTPQIPESDYIFLSGLGGLLAGFLIWIGIIINL